MSYTPPPEILARLGEADVEEALRAVTPHNLVWKARRVGPGRRAAEAKERWARLVRGPE